MSGKINFVSVNGQKLTIASKVLVKISTTGNSMAVCIFVCSDIANEVLLGYTDLCKLGEIDEDFPALCHCIMRVTPHCDSSQAASRLKAKLVKEFPTILSSALPELGMKGSKMEIFLNDWSDITHMKILTARPIPIHFH